MRGARRRALHDHMQHLLQKNEPSMAILLETKVENVSNNHTFQLLTKSLGLPSNATFLGTSRGGGLWIYWDPLSVDAKLIQQSTQHITLSRTFTADRAVKGFFTAICASPNWQARRNLWDTLIHLKNNQCSAQTSRVLLRDFNCILSPHEKRRGLPMEPTMAIKDFQNFITEAYLQDMGFVGTPFTWSNL